MEEYRPSIRPQSRWQDIENVDRFTPHRGGVFDERRGCRSGRGSQWEQQRHCLGKR